MQKVVNATWIRNRNEYLSDVTIKLEGDEITTIVNHWDLMREAIQRSALPVAHVALLEKQLKLLKDTMLVFMEEHLKTLL